MEGEGRWLQLFSENPNIKLKHFKGFFTREIGFFQKLVIQFWPTSCSCMIMVMVPQTNTGSKQLFFSQNSNKWYRDMRGCVSRAICSNIIYVEL